ncbi:NADPH-dependent F420 reductase [Streptomyces sp. AV19]|uniref:NADPH-dependent F420 reductase n=1 Tax=Streptomyces sp. AV19 TaxID=2793068 RepID=UPI0018FE7042|nr:NADPH-dependent F420 reductase [Streptomyces sp. AV19]MBH1937676.1 NADPH-dependent F420 reductase [Streptomyces sp. AV19]MDG4536343.1 NADPH-dependent F420 reductase [Streptomyces sp. AV19]
MRVGIIGAGRLGTALARHFTRAGHEVMLANSRGPETLTSLVGELGDRATAGTPQEAADFGDVVVLAVQWSQKESAAGLVSSWEGRVVLDPVNPLRDTPAGIEAVDTGGRHSSEIVASLLPGARLVKGFNTYLYTVLAEDPAVRGGRRVVLLAGDDPDAKRKVAELADSAGFQPLDAGPLAQGGALFETGGPLSKLAGELVAL